MYKIALNAGHSMNTPGKRCLKSIDPNETRENFLNRRICDKVEAKLKAYEGYELIRCDDITGAVDYDIQKRANTANNFGADIYIGVHHNAAIYGGSGGGIEAYVYINVDEATKAIQKALYDAVIKHTGLKGNRAQPLRQANFGECRLTRMRAVLLECGYMDSTVDTPIILTDKFADQVAEGIVEALVADGKLTKKPVATNDEVIPDNVNEYFRVQLGAFKHKANAIALQNKLKAAGYDAIIKRG